MKIFAFDTKFKARTVNTLIGDFGNNGIIVISRSKLFLWLHVLLPTFIYIALCLAFVGMAYSYPLFESVKYLVRILIIIFIILVCWPIIKNYIDYVMDFMVVTPSGVYMYNQRGILDRSGKFLNKQNIRSIYIQQQGIIYSLFNNGELLIMSEGTPDDMGDIKMRYIKNPLSLAQELDDVLMIEKNTNSLNN